MYFRPSSPTNLAHRRVNNADMSFRLLELNMFVPKACLAISDHEVKLTLYFSRLVDLSFK